MELELNRQLCIDCGMCEKVCPSIAVHPQTATFDNTCISCYQCLAVCQPKAITLGQMQPHPITPHGIQPEAFEALIGSRRSVRLFKPKPVEEELLNRIIATLHQTPTASNGRKTGIVVITDPEKLEQLNNDVYNSLLSTYQKFTNPLMSPIARLLLGKKYSLLKQYKKNFAEKRKTRPMLVTHSAPVVILVYQEPGMMGLPEADTNLWAGFAMLYARTFGLETCYNGFIVKALSRSNELSRKYGIPKGKKVYASLLMGYPSVKYHNTAPRKAFEVIRINKKSSFY